MYIGHYQLYWYVGRQRQLLEENNRYEQFADSYRQKYVYRLLVVDIQHMYLLDDIDNRDGMCSNRIRQLSRLVNNIDH